LHLPQGRPPAPALIAIIAEEKIMSEPFQGQIEIFGFNFAPKNWAQCNGQILSINQNQALFSLLGTTYGGNGATTFALPDLRSRVPLGSGKDRQQTNWAQGQKGGAEGIKLTSFQIPAHVHQLKAASGAEVATNTNLPDPTVGLGQTSGTTSGGTTLNVLAYVPDAAPGATLGDTALSPATGGQPHENRMPLLVLNICICLLGLYPSRT
jgi:microcystin-dependent protein